MSRAKSNRTKDQLFYYFGVFSTFIGLFVLAIFIGFILYLGLTRIDGQFLTSLPSRIASKAGILTAWTGTLWIFILTALCSIPIGVAAGIYLEEYSVKNKWSNLLEVNIANLAGVPSIIYGLLGLGVLVRSFKLGESLLAGALTLGLLILPIIIVSTREALKAVPDTIRQASYAVGATKWQTVRHQVLPAAGGGIATGVILGLARAIGETAPLIVVGALAYVPFIAKSPMDEYSVLPMQIFNWVSRPQHEFTINAAAAIIVLLIITFLLNGLAAWLRLKWQKNAKW